MTQDIILVGDPRDEHSDSLLARLSDLGQGHRVARLSLRTLVGMRFTWTATGLLRIGNDIVIDREPCAGIFRRPGQVDVSGFDPDYGAFVASEYYDAFHGALAENPIRWVTPPLALVHSEYKLVQLRAASALGLRVPSTVVTNEPPSLDFPDGPELVIKPVRYGLLTATSPPRVAYAQLVSRADLNALDGPPVIVQERIRATWHLRVVTVGRDAIFIAGLPAGDAIDWRADEANHRRFTRDVAVPSDVVEGALRLASYLHLGLSAQDWLVAADGDAVFLEANPSGQWLFIDELFGGAITNAVADHLLSLAAA